MYRVKKIIVDWDTPQARYRYHRQTFTLAAEVDYPFMAGSLKLLIREAPNQTGFEEWPEDLGLPDDFEMFNEQGLASIIPPVGSHGLYYLKLRPDHKLEKLYVEPEDVYIDLFFGGRVVNKKFIPDKTLIYSFYNPTRRNAIKISCRVVPDTENIWQKIMANSDDLYWRQFFVNDARAGNIIEMSTTPPVRELMNLEQVADYLQVAPKTIQNWTTDQKIPSERIPGTREVRYRKSDIDEAMRSANARSRRRT